MEIEKKISKFWNKISSVQKAAFFSTLIWGFITHLAVFSAGLMYHDGLTYSGLNATYTSGRWMLGIIEDICSRCLGIYQLPFINGFLTLFFLAVISMLITKLLNISSYTASVFTGAILVSFPSVATLFSYMYTAPAYSLSLLMSIAAIYTVNEAPTGPRIAAGAALMCMSLGIYQAYICFAASLALIIVICDILRQSEADIKTGLKKGCIFIVTLFIGLVLYLLVNKIFISLKDVTISTYQGLDKMGQFSLEDFIKAVKYAYTYQLRCYWLGIISTTWMLHLTRTFNAASALLFFCTVYRCKGNIKKCIFAVILFLLLPLALNSIYLICAGGLTGIHSLMQYSLIFTYIFPLVLLEILLQGSVDAKCGKILSTVSLLLALLVPFSYTYRDNTAYLSISTAQQQAILYYNSFITRIRNTEGYRDEMPVAYIGQGINDTSLDSLPSYGSVWTHNLYDDCKKMINRESWKKFCALHLGWAPQEITNTEEVAQSEEVKAMPCYPDSGSIRIIDGVIVIKISQPD